MSYYFTSLYHIYYVVGNQIWHNRCDRIEGAERKRPWLIQIRYEEPLLEGVSRNRNTCSAEIRLTSFPCVSPMVYNYRRTLLRYSEISLIRLSNKQVTNFIVGPI
jgi:hypothetical protein